MKLLATLLALGAGQAYADTEYATYIPIDCYSEDTAMSGNPNGNLVSDYRSMTGLDAYSHKLVGVTACVDNKKQIISGITTKWARWSNGQQTDVKRLNIIGKLSGLYHFSDGTSVNDDGDELLQRYWFQEAREEQEQQYRTLDWMSGKSYDEAIGSTAWTESRNLHFQASDLDGNGTLNRQEGHEFLKKVRPLDGKTHILDTRYERVNRHFDAITTLAGKDEFNLNDYKSLEETMMRWYVNDKLTEVGWTQSDTDVRTFSSADLTHVCSDLELTDADDRIIHTAIEAGPEAIFGIAIQTVNNPYWAVGVSDFSDSSVDADWRVWGSEQAIAGLMGTTNSDGDLQGLGFVVRDNTCSQPFVDALGANYSWTSPKDAVASIPQRSAAHVARLNAIQERLDYLLPGPIDEHNHDGKAESGLVAVTIIVWVAVIIIAGVMIFQMCRMRKGGSSVTRE